MWEKRETVTRKRKFGQKLNKGVELEKQIYNDVELENGENMIIDNNVIIVL